MPTENKKQPKDNGRKLFQPMYINWSYLYLGKVARVTMKKTTPRAIFKLNQTLPGRKEKGGKSTIGSQPPKNKRETNALIKSMLAYSPRKNNFITFIKFFYKISNINWIILKITINN